MRKILAAALAGALMIGGPALLAQEESSELKAEDLYKSSREAYDAKKYGKAMADLRLLLAAVGKARQEQLKSCFPAAPAGWTADEFEASDLSGFGGGLGITLKRTYRKGDDHRVAAQLLLDSPMIAMTVAMLTNPMIVQNTPGASIVKWKGKQALMTYDKESKNGKLQVPMQGNAALFELHGEGVEKADIEALGKAFDADAIEKALAS